MEKILVEMENACEEILHKAISMISYASIIDWFKFGFQILMTPYGICILLIFIISFTITVFQREGVNMLTLVKIITSATLMVYGIIMLCTALLVGKFVLILLTCIILFIGLILIAPKTYTFP